MHEDGLIAARNFLAQQSARDRINLFYGFVNDHLKRPDNEKAIRVLEAPFSRSAAATQVFENAKTAATIQRIAHPTHCFYRS
jgi:hypothetical protein